MGRPEEKRLLGRRSNWIFKQWHLWTGFKLLMVWRSGRLFCIHWFLLSIQTLPILL